MKGRWKKDRDVEDAEETMSDIPTLTTKRLQLRPFRMDDAPVVQELAGAYSIAAHTTDIPHPYPDGQPRNGSPPTQKPSQKEQG